MLIKKLYRKTQKTRQFFLFTMENKFQEQLVKELKNTVQQTWEALIHVHSISSKIHKIFGNMHTTSK